MAIRTWWVLALVWAVFAGACQPVDRLELDEAPEPVVEEDAGAAASLPRDLEALVERADAIAREWQRNPVLAEVAVSLDGERWRRARVLYVAADADRFLSVRFDTERMSQERVTLATLGLEPVPAHGVEAIPELPDDTLEPAALVDQARPHLDGCLQGPPTEVIYDTGAPASWQGQGWADAPVWTATLWHAAADGGGQGRRVDPVSGEPVDDGCATVGA